MSKFGFIGILSGIAAIVGIVLYGAKTTEKLEQQVQASQTMYESLKSEQDALGNKVDLMKVQIELLQLELSDTRYLASFGWAPYTRNGIVCDGSRYKEGTLGASAYRALRATQLCEPKPNSPPAEAK